MKVGATGLVTSLATALALFVAGVAFAGPVDSDGDGIVDSSDNCPTTFNPTQTNTDVTADAPGDPQGDACDNCRDLCNTLQIDSDHDGCGNECDADFNNDGVVAGADFQTLLANFGTTVPPTAPEIDLTGGPACGVSGIGIPDGNVAGADFQLLLSVFGSPPGPGIPPDTDCDGDGAP